MCSAVYNIQYSCGINNFYFYYVVSKTPQEVCADAIAGSDGGMADQEEEYIVTQSQEGGGNGGEEMVTGVHDRNAPTTNINTDNKTLTSRGNSEDRGGKVCVH